MRGPLQLTDEVRRALDTGQPVVALESAVIAHGLPYPTNLDVARAMEAAIRLEGAVPATVALIKGEIRVGLTDQDMEHLALAAGIRKVSRRDLPIAVAARLDGATTVAATAAIAACAHVEVFATGGIGGVHRSPPFDVSNDLPTLASVRMAVVCSGAKSILDLLATLEWLETAGVPVIGYGTDEFPAFFSRRSGLRVDHRVDTPDQAAAIIHSNRQLGLSSGILIAVPVPAEHELPAEVAEQAIAEALAEADARHVEGSALTPFLLRRVAQASHGASLTANVALLRNNAAVAAQIAVALSRLS